MPDPVPPLTPAQLAQIRKDAGPYLSAAMWRGFIVGAFLGFVAGWGVWSILFFQRQ